MTTVFIFLLIVYLLVGVFVFSKPPLNGDLKSGYDSLARDYFKSKSVIEKFKGVFGLLAILIIVPLLLLIYPIAMMTRGISLRSLINPDSKPTPTFQKKTKTTEAKINQQQSNRLNRNLLFDKFPIIETQNLILRELRSSDIPQLFKLYVDKDVAKEFEFENPETYDYDVTLKNITDGFKLRQSISWGMILKKENLLIGVRTCFIDGDNDPAVFEGMVLNGYRARGYTTEAYIAIIKLLRQANVKAIKAKTKKYNKPAISMLEKFGFINVSRPNTFAYVNDNVYTFEKDLTHENSLLLSDTKVADNLNADAYYDLSVKYYKESQYALAKDCIDKAITKKAKQADFYYQRGLVVLASLGRLKALPDFQRAVEINPKHANAIIESGNIMYELGNKSGGRELWNKAANLGSERAVKLLRNNPDWKQ